MNVKQAGLTGVNCVYRRMRFGKRRSGMQFRRLQRKPKIHNSMNSWANDSWQQWYFSVGLFTFVQNGTPEYAGLNMQDAICKTQYARRNTQDSKRKTQNARLNTQDAIRKTQYARLNTQDAIRKTQYARLNTQDAIRNTQYAPTASLGLTIYCHPWWLYPLAIGTFRTLQLDYASASENSKYGSLSHSTKLHDKTRLTGLPRVKLGPFTSVPNVCCFLWSNAV